MKSVCPNRDVDCNNMDSECAQKKHITQSRRRVRLLCPMLCPSLYVFLVPRRCLKGIELVHEFSVYFYYVKVS